MEPYSFLFAEKSETTYKGKDYYDSYRKHGQAKLFYKHFMLGLRIRMSAAYVSCHKQAATSGHRTKAAYVGG